MTPILKILPLMKLFLQCFILPYGEKLRFFQRVSAITYTFNTPSLSFTAWVLPSLHAETFPCYIYKGNSVYAKLPVPEPVPEPQPDPEPEPEPEPEPHQLKALR